MGYGGYLHSGLAAIPGARYAADALKTPERVGFTGTAQGGTLRALYGQAPRMKTKVYGEIPLEEIEGHQVDPLYDVRGSGLGQVPTMVSGRRTGRGELPPLRSLNARAAVRELPPSSLAAAPSSSPDLLLYGGLALATWFLLRGRL